MSEENHVRISFGNLVRDLVDSDGRSFGRIGIYNRNSHREEKPRIDVPGGAAHFTADGIFLAMTQCRAFKFELDIDSATNKVKGVDTRYRVPAEFGDAAIAFHEDPANEKYFECDPLREVVEEFTADDKGLLPPVLTLEEALQLRSRYLGTVRQPAPESAGTSKREVEGVLSRRVFRMHTLIAPPEIALRLVSAPAIYMLHKEEVASTGGGTRKGVTKTGVMMADNHI